MTKEEYNVELALTFNYGQKSVEREIAASEKICKYYGIEHKVIRLDGLKIITQTALVSDKEVPFTREEDLASDEFVNKARLRFGCRIETALS